MSAPQGPRGASRGRGQGRARSNGGRLRDGSGDEQTRGDARRSQPSARRAASTRPSAPAPKQQAMQTVHANISWRNGATTKIPQTGSHTSLDVSQFPTTNTADQSWRDPTIEGTSTYQKRMSELYQTLKKNREKERKEAIRNGFLADPDRPTSLANAITPVGTCQDMCPEFERVERIVQLMVDGCEKTKAQSTGTKVPYENFMVKRFRRSAAGYDEQLPSDIRPPLVLQKTLNYLFEEIIGGTQSLASVHKFVWDRTRGIRNDFSIQQVTRIEDLRVAIDCFERIARFHILSLHQLSRPGHDNGEFDHHQEREQLNNTLLSLMYYYDDSRHKLTSPNEAEFRAYCIIFEIQDQRPDLEDRAQSWPRPFLKDPRIQTAMKLYAAAGNISDEQGPLRPRASFSIAQANYGRFWAIVGSNAVSYLMACAAEMYFNAVRRMALDAIWKAYKRGGISKVEDWILGDLATALGFDNEMQVQTFCEDHGFTIGKGKDGEAYLDVGSVTGKWLTDSNPRRKQIFSKRLVEQKRLGRTLTAVINGLSASQARTNCQTEDTLAGNSSPQPNDNNESLFLSDGSDQEKSQATKAVDTRHNADRTEASTAFDASAKPLASNPFQPIPTSTAPPQINSFPTTLTSVFGKPGEPLISATLFGQPITVPFQPASVLQQSSHTPTFNFGVPSSTISTNSNSPFAPSRTQMPQIASTLDQPTSSSNPPAITGQPSNQGSAFGQPTSYANPPATFGQPSSQGSTFGQPTSYANPPATFGQPSSQGSTFGQPTSYANPPATFGQPSSQGKPLEYPQLQSSSLFLPNKTSTVPSENTAQPANFSVRDSPVQRSTPPIHPSPRKTKAEDITPPNTPTTLPSTVPHTPSLLSSLNTKPTAVSTTEAKSPFPFQPASAPVPPTSNSSVVEAAKPSTALIGTSLLHPKAGPQETSRDPRLTTPLPQIAPSAPTNSKSSTLPDLHAVFTSQVTQVSPLSVPTSSTSTTIPPLRQTKIGSSKPDLRPAVLDALSTTVMLQENGLLQQFLEHTLGPIVTNAMIQVKDELSWEAAAEVRQIILGKKYLQRWKENAWRLGLLRKGRERRKNFAQSMRNLAKSSRRGSTPSTETIDKHEVQAPRSNVTFPTPSSSAPMAPPSRLLSGQQTRRSLPNKSEEQAKTDNNRKPDELANISNLKTPRHIKAHHKRSNTLHDATALSKSTAHGHSNRFSMSNFRSSHFTNGSLLSESVVKQARRLVPAGRMDTTQTDYFRLKALGVDPDTPIVPATRKRRITGETGIEKNKMSRLSPPNLSSISPQKNRTLDTSQKDLNSHARASPASYRKTASQDNSEDEELFAQLRQVREAMSDSINWFRSEREKSEMSRSSSRSQDRPRRIETDKEKRVREFTRTPSRTEIRLRETGASGLLPEDYWSNKSSRKAKGEAGSHGEGMKKSPSTTPQPQARGFAAMGNGFGLSRRGDGARFTDTVRKGSAVFGEASGESVDDAIEL